MENATEQAVKEIMYVTSTQMGWPEAFMWVGCAFAVALIVYSVIKHL